MATRAVPAPAKQPPWQLKDVPPFPALAIKALNLMGGTDTSLLELCNLIRPDPAFSAEILRFANSPLVAFSKQIVSVLQASMLLGFRRLRSIVITVGMRTYVAGGSTPLLECCWRHSVASAIIAERAANACSLDKDSAYTGAILHDVGRLVLAVSMPQDYARVIERGADSPEELLRNERALCGIDHCEAGGEVVRTWGLPNTFVEITSGHHMRDQRATDITSIVARSCRLADSLGFSVVVFGRPRSYSEILEDFAEPARRVFPANDKELASEIAEQIRIIESV